MVVKDRRIESSCSSKTLHISEMTVTKHSLVSVQQEVRATSDNMEQTLPNRMHHNHSLVDLLLKACVIKQQRSTKTCIESWSQIVERMDIDVE